MIVDISKERNAALFSLDRDTIIAYCEKYQIPVPDDGNAFWGGVCKAILNIPEAPEDVRKRATEWLAWDEFFGALKEGLT